MERERSKYESLYRADTLPADLPLDFQPDADPVDDTVPKEEEIRRAVFRMRSRKAPGLTQVSVDHLKWWYSRSHPEREGTTPNESALEHWLLVVQIVQVCFRTGVFPQCF